MRAEVGILKKVAGADWSRKLPTVDADQSRGLVLSPNPLFLTAGD